MEEMMRKLASLLMLLAGLGLAGPSFADDPPAKPEKTKKAVKKARKKAAKKVVKKAPKKKPAKAKKADDE
jgi:hypothetical protein